MKQSDSENLSLIYEDILEEGWKSKAMGLAAAGAGAMALFPSNRVSARPVTSQSGPCC